MATITSAGVGSGLDLEAIIQATLDAENLPKLQKFQEKEQTLSFELSAIGAIKSSLSSLDDTIEKLADIENFNKRTSTVTQPASGDLISVSASADSTPGDFDIEVMQLAQGSRAVSSPGLFTAPEDVISATGGNLTFEAGAKSFSVNVAAGATLEEIRQAINDSNDNFGVSVNIINTGTEAKLVITSDETGTGNDLIISNDNAELDNISTHKFGEVTTGPGTGGLAIAVADQAQDAIIEVDGISISSESNTFKDAIQDSTITVLKESVDNETARLSIDVDKGSVEETIGEFITAFNNVMQTIDYHTQIGAPLNGDSSMRGLKNQLIQTLSNTVTGAGGYETLFDVGLGLNKEGNLEKSSLVRSLSDALSENYDDVGAVFAGTDGIATSFAGVLDNYLESDGAFQFRQDALNADLKQLENDRENHTYRMEQLEVTLREKYSALDVLIANMQSQSSYLAAQLANLPGFTRPSSSS
ncbi:flagellar filament capping protein FliD [Thalassotalea sp. M1531]|uniref:Flagellar hook-associated protein 2 n=1 Tax=Thalassotalea algicola TaxID=2716224 RepID=A0A7Y0LE51_9GAMM|nr:flagellar filament capping protein FliD [Thalassotalea algicola]NMP32889.1 flagellar filament capping protein FliD [Thalassotalea algicola]